VYFGLLHLDVIRLVMCGLHTAGGKMVSGGQNQKVGLIRVLAFKRPLIIMDEPLNHLDQQTKGWLVRHLNGIKELNKTDKNNYMPTIIIISHDTSLADIADDVIVMVPPEMEQLLSKTRIDRRHWGPIADQIYNYNIRDEKQRLDMAHHHSSWRHRVESKLTQLKIPELYWNIIIDMIHSREIPESGWKEVAETYTRFF
jgi:ABC-type nitrate/sulfonate/bicarbonate transport system ATPase subunit